MRLRNDINQLTFVFPFAETRSIKRMWRQLTERICVMWCLHVKFQDAWDVYPAVYTVRRRLWQICASAQASVARNDRLYKQRSTDNMEGLYVSCLWLVWAWVLVGSLWEICLVCLLFGNLHKSCVCESYCSYIADSIECHREGLRCHQRPGRSDLWPADHGRPYCCSQPVLFLPVASAEVNQTVIDDRGHKDTSAFICWESARLL